MCQYKMIWARFKVKSRSSGGTWGKICMDLFSYALTVEALTAPLFYIMLWWTREMEHICCKNYLQIPLLIMCKSMKLGVHVVCVYCPVLLKENMEEYNLFNPNVLYRWRGGAEEAEESQAGCIPPGTLYIQGSIPTDTTSALCTLWFNDIGWRTSGDMLTLEITAEDICQYSFVINCCSDVVVDVWNVFSTNCRLIMTWVSSILKVHIKLM